jgi:hypothetical protein
MQFQVFHVLFERSTIADKQSCECQIEFEKSDQLFYKIMFAEVQKIANKIQQFSPITSLCIASLKKWLIWQLIKCYLLANNNKSIFLEKKLLAHCRRIITGSLGLHFFSSFSLQSSQHISFFLSLADFNLSYTH